jgi:hypothetical protein
MSRDYLPDHQLIVAATIYVVRIRRREHIIRNITPYVARLVIPPGNVRGHLLGLADQYTLVQDLASVRVALNIVLATGPCPLGAPLDA